MSEPKAKALSPYRECIEALSMVYLDSGVDVVDFLTNNGASRSLMLDGYLAYVNERKFEPIEALPRAERQSLWDMVKYVPGETVEQKTNLCRAIFFLMWKYENKGK